MRRYLRNQSTISTQQQVLLANKTVAIVGCGGLGGYVIEQCARIGIGKLLLFDDDVFDESNLNRQRFSNEDVIGMQKVLVTLKEVEKINSSIQVIPHVLKLNMDHLSLLKDVDVLVDAVDRISTRLMLQEMAESLNIPLVSASIAGWYGQCTVVFPQDRTLSKIYPKDAEVGIEVELGNPAFTPALLASIEVAEIVKILLDIPSTLHGKLLVVNLLHHEYTVIDLL